MKVKLRFLSIPVILPLIVFIIPSLFILKNNQFSLQALKIILGFFITSLVIAFYNGIHRILHGYQVAKNGIKVQGEISDKWGGDDRGMLASPGKLTISYEAHSKTYKTSFFSFLGVSPFFIPFSMYPIGKAVTVICDKYNPEDCFVADFFPLSVEGSLVNMQKTKADPALKKKTHFLHNLKNKTDVKDFFTKLKDELQNESIKFNLRIEENVLNDARVETSYVLMIGEKVLSINEDDGSTTEYYEGEFSLETYENGEVSVGPYEINRLDSEDVYTVFGKILKQITNTSDKRNDGALLKELLSGINLKSQLDRMAFDNNLSHYGLEYWIDEFDDNNKKKFHSVYIEF